MSDEALEMLMQNGDGSYYSESEEDDVFDVSKDR